jgi:predicted nucleic acid-binding protein
MLLDTSGLLCLHNRAEPLHGDARTLYHAARIRVTHSYVLAEFVALAHARRLPRMAALTFISDLIENPDIEQYGWMSGCIVKRWPSSWLGQTKRPSSVMR